MIAEMCRKPDLSTGWIVSTVAKRLAVKTSSRRPLLSYMHYLHDNLVKKMCFVSFIFKFWCIILLFDVTTSIDLIITI